MQNTTVTDFVVKSTIPGEIDQVVSSLASTSNTQENAGNVYRVGSNNIIYIYDAESLAVTNHPLASFTGSVMSKIQVSKTE